MIILAIDPGTTRSAALLYDSGGRRVLHWAMYDNARLADQLRGGMFGPEHWPWSLTAIEMIASYGMAVGRDVFETCVWIGRFLEASPVRTELAFRRDIKLHLCGSARARDPNIRQALMDMFGGERAARGTKRDPGPLYGVATHGWAALAVAVYVADMADHTSCKKEG